jgi:imidazolonepropionase-like amidohydrolase
MSGAPIKDGIILTDKNGKISAVGPASSVKIPSGTKVRSAKVVTPGLIDAHSVVGLAGYLNYNQDQDQLETSSPMQPQLRAVDAYNARERLVEWVRSYGITTLHTGHGPGALMSGQTMVVKTRGNTVEAALIDSATMLAMTLGPEAEDRGKGKGPGTRAKGVAMVRAEFLKARHYLDQMAKDTAPDKKPARDLELETVARVLQGRMPALITAHEMPDILAALRLQKEFGFKLVLDGASEAYLLIDEIKAAGVPVILHPTMVRTGGITASATLETAHRLMAAGIPVALQSGYEGYVPKTRVVLFEAGMAAANGLSTEEALSTITSTAAKIIGQDKRIGTLEVGKDADIVLYDGDPFEWTSHVCTVLIEGAVVSDSCQ